MNKTLNSIQEQLEVTAAERAKKELDETVALFRAWLIVNCDCDISEASVTQPAEMSLTNILDLLAEASKPFVIRKFQQREIDNFIAKTKLG